MNKYALGENFGMKPLAVLDHSPPPLDVPELQASAPTQEATRDWGFLQGGPQV